MTVYEFLKLGTKERGDYLFAHGTFVTNTGDAKGLSAFYSLDGFFVDVVFDLEFNTIVSAVPFKEGERYDRMVAAMDSPTL